MDETEAEQGIAHVVEHVTFLGSRKREELLGTGARSNAYTDFHHTVFHYHSPVTDATTGTSYLYPLSCPLPCPPPSSPSGSKPTWMKMFVHTNSNNTGEAMLPRILEALEDIAFHPEFLSTRIEKERKVRRLLYANRSDSPCRILVDIGPIFTHI